MKKKLQQVTTTAVLSFVFVMNSIQAPASAAAPTLKVQLQTLIKKANATWPKIGSYRILDNDYGMSLPLEIYFYNDQIEFITLSPGYAGAVDKEIQLFDPLYSYRKFPSKSASAQRALDDAGMKRADWYRYTGGYSGNNFSDFMPARNPNNLYGKEVKSKEKYFTLPVSIVQNAVVKSKSISQNNQSKLWIISGTCERSVMNSIEGLVNPDRDITFSTVLQKCNTYVSFSANGRIKSLSQSFVDGYSDRYVFDTINPTEPIVDHLYVIDSETGKLAVYP